MSGGYLYNITLCDVIVESIISNESLHMVHMYAIILH